MSPEMQVVVRRSDFVTLWDVLGLDAVEIEDGCAVVYSSSPSCDHFIAQWQRDDDGSGTITLFLEPMAASEYIGQIQERLADMERSGQDLKQLPALRRVLDCLLQTSGRMEMVA